MEKGRYNLSRSDSTSLLGFVLVLAISSLISFPSTSAHPGELAADGCHYCRTNCEKYGLTYGKRHCQDGDRVLTPSAPKLLTKKITSGTTGEVDSEIIFEVINEDPNHQLKGYLSCGIPSDVIVTSSVGAASGEQGEYISSALSLETAPARETMSLRLSATKPGTKVLQCALNYALYHSQRGYVSPKGEYSNVQEYEKITLSRDIEFRADESQQKATLNQSLVFLGIAIVLALIVLLLSLRGAFSRNKKKH